MLENSDWRHDSKEGQRRESGFELQTHQPFEHPGQALREGPNNSVVKTLRRDFLLQSEGPQNLDEHPLVAVIEPGDVAVRSGRAEMQARPARTG